MWKDGPSKKGSVHILLHEVHSFRIYLMVFVRLLEKGVSKVNSKDDVSSKQLWFTLSHYNVVRFSESIL